MPPPATAPIASPSISKSPTKKKLSRNLSGADSEASDYNNATTPSLSNRSTIKSDKSFVKNNKPSMDNDGLETGSDSDAVEEIPSSQQPIVVTKFGGGTTKLYNDHRPNNTTPDLNSSKSYETNWRRSVGDSHDTNLRTNRSTTTTTTILDSIRNDSLSSRDNSKKDDLLSSYETPYLSEFTRRLSVQASVNLPSLSKSSLKGNFKRKFLNILIDLK